ncbi:MAG: hypothetical protein K9K82_13715 [Desulfobacteraceae bacterium]|nr:hypothetical protein [Desulfobacteraceae bacterium]MCF8050810.1 hypothetical protein [Desulfobacterales bacterium]
MEKDPFGNLTDWGPVLDLLDELSENGTISKCQPGLIRILRYKGNWRLREEALKRVNKVENPCDGLVLQISNLLADDNLYYDARILAGNALVQLSKNTENGFPIELNKEIQKVIIKLQSTPHPPFFEYAVEKVHSNVIKQEVFEN